MGFQNGSFVNGIPPNGLVSRTLIEFAAIGSGHFFGTNNPPPVGLINPIQHLAGGLFGAVWAIGWECIRGDGIKSGKEYWNTAAGGFIGGAIGAV